VRLRNYEKKDANKQNALIISESDALSVLTNNLRQTIVPVIFILEAQKVQMSRGNE